jgi:transposase
MRIIGLDVHRSFAEVAILDRGAIRRAGRILLEHGRIIEFGKTLDLSDEVVLEATGNTAIIVRLLRPFVRRVVVANPLQVRAIAWAKVKTDKIDAAVLAKLHASGFLPEVWVADEDTEVLRRRVTERTQLVTQMTRLKNRIHAVLHANLIPRYHAKLFGKAGRLWLDAQPIASDQKRIIARYLDEHDHIGTALAELEKELAGCALKDIRVKCLMTIGGVNAIVAISVLAAIGDIGRFPSPGKARQLFWSKSEGPAIGRPASVSWTDQQTGPVACPCDASRGGVVYSNPTGTATRVFPSHQREARPANRRGCNCTQTRKSDLAYTLERGGLRLDPAGPHAMESTRA